MTIGIYRLCFNGTDQCYVGQSVDIERRFNQHLLSFSKCSAVTKLQEAYNKYGKPYFEVLCVCTISDLDNLEEEAIKIFDSVNNGFNTIALSELMHNNKGISNPNSKYSETQIIEAAKLLTDTDNTAKYISSVVGIPETTVRDIACFNSHNWLQEAAPEVYKKLLSVKGLRYKAQSLEYRGKSYPPVLSPLDTVYTIKNLLKFCEEHVLDRSALRRVLQGKVKTHKGWRLSENV
jgi:group I intron endonuclease